MSLGPKNYQFAIEYLPALEGKCWRWLIFVVAEQLLYIYRISNYIY